MWAGTVRLLGQRVWSPMGTATQTQNCFALFFNQHFKSFWVKTPGKLNWDSWWLNQQLLEKVTHCSQISASEESFSALWLDKRILISKAITFKSRVAGGILALFLCEGTVLTNYVLLMSLFWSQTAKRWPTSIIYLFFLHKLWTNKGGCCRVASPCWNHKETPCNSAVNEGFLVLMNQPKIRAFLLSFRENSQPFYAVIGGDVSGVRLRQFRASNVCAVTRRSVSIFLCAQCGATAGCLVYEN